MSCPSCGTLEPGTGAYCTQCGARLPAPAAVTPAYVPPLASPALAQQTSPPPAVRPAPGQTSTQTSQAMRNSETTIHHISAGSVFKVTFIIYALLLAVFGCFAIVLPGFLSSGLLGGFAGDDYGMSVFGGGIISTLILYLLLIVLGAFVQGVVTAIGALIYNLVAGWVGGVRVELR